MINKILLWLENKWCIYKYGKTRQQIIDEYLKHVEWKKNLRRIYMESLDIDHNIYFGDR